MKRSQICVCSALLGICLLVYLSAQVKVADLRSNVDHKLHVSAVALPPEVLKALAGEFKGLLADYLLLEAASTIGGSEVINDQQWHAVASLLEQSSILDPYFQLTYILTQGSLPWQANKIEQTLSILQRSKIHRTWDWRPGFLMGFDYFYFKKDYTAASRELMQASQVPGAPITLATWASRLASKSGQYDAAMDFLTAMIENTEDEQQKATLRDRITAIRGAYQLQQAVNIFKKQFGRYPKDFDELIDCSLISEIPKNPYEKEYFLKDGIVEF